jgi:ribosomal protein S18 acetylase RimI-like enzyme
MFGEMYAHLSGFGYYFFLDENNLRKYLEDRIDSKFSKLYVCEYDGALIGFINLSVLKSNSNFKGYPFYGFINDLYVKKDFRGKKVGSALIEKAERFFDARAAAGLINRIECHALCANVDAIRLYKKLGFKENYVSLIKMLE